MRRRKRSETPMELYARMDTPVYAHVKLHGCGCVTAWDVKGQRYTDEIHVCGAHSAAGVGHQPAEERKPNQ